MSDTPGFFLDAEVPSTGEQYAVIYTPRRQRSRFPANCVQLCATETAASDAADSSRHLYAAKVVGPSKSSEGLMMYYLVRWLG